MTLALFVQRCKKLAALWSVAPKKYVAIVYFDGPLTKWNRSTQNFLFTAYPGGLRIPMVYAGPSALPLPDEREVIQRCEFRYELMARTWVVARLRGFDHTKVVGEVRPL